MKEFNDSACALRRAKTPEKIPDLTGDVIQNFSAETQFFALTSPEVAKAQNSLYELVVFLLTAAKENKNNLSMANAQIDSAFNILFVRMNPHRTSMESAQETDVQNRISELSNGFRECAKQKKTYGAKKCKIYKDLATKTDRILPFIKQAHTRVIH